MLEAGRFHTFESRQLLIQTTLQQQITHETKQLFEKLINMKSLK